MDKEREDRQDILMFLGFVVLCASVVLTIVVARGTWSSDTWTAVGAIASGVQAIGVFSALVYAARQIRHAESVARGARDEELLDRFETVTFEELLPSWVAMWSAYQRAARVLPRAVARHRGFEVSDPETTPAEEFTRAVDELESAEKRTARARAKAFRTLARLGVRSQELQDMEIDRRRRVVMTLAKVGAIEMYDFGIHPRPKAPDVPDWPHADMTSRYEALADFAGTLLSRMPPKS